MNRVTRIVLFASLIASACGGVAFEGRNDQSGTGGDGTGGASAGGKVIGAGGKVGGGKGGTGNVAGHETGPGGSIGIAGYSGGGGIPGAGGCCAAEPACNLGDQSWGRACPPDASCYPVTACCTTIYCVSRSTCTVKANPCPPYDQQIFGACPPGRVCYQLPTCSSYITCMSSVIPDAGPLPDAGSCVGPAPRGVHYVSKSPAQCQVIDYACPSSTTGYSDACGCGCRQPDTCPDYVNCQPGLPGPQPVPPQPVPLDPFCVNNGMCPYTVRAY